MGIKKKLAGYDNIKNFNIPIGARTDATVTPKTPVKRKSKSHHQQLVYSPAAHTQIQLK